MHEKYAYMHMDGFYEVSNIQKQESYYGRKKTKRADDPESPAGDRTQAGRATDQAKRINKFMRAERIYDFSI